MFFVFDEKAQEKSRYGNELILTCYYEDFYRNNSTIESRWKKQFITFSDLTFGEKYNVFYHDSEDEKRKLQRELQHSIITLPISGTAQLLSDTSSVRADASKKSPTELSLENTKSKD
jgi:hypothetical protein